MSIQKKSLISTLKTTKKANVATSESTAKTVSPKMASIHSKSAVVTPKRANVKRAPVS